MENNKNINLESKESSDINAKETVKTEVANGVKDDDKMFTQKEVEKIVSKRLERDRKKAEAEKKEAEELAKMSEAEKQQAILEKKERQLQIKEKELQRKELLNFALRYSQEKGMDSKLNQYLDKFICDDKETTINKVDQFISVVNDCVEVGIKERLKNISYKPPQGNTTTLDKNPYSLENFNLTKQMELEIKNPDMAKKLKENANKK